MNIFLDCEFNGFGGELLSIGMVAETSNDWLYAIVADTKDPPTEWVAENVLPVMDSFYRLGKRVSRDEIRETLHGYLARWPTIHVIADWPEDIIHFCRLLLTDKPGERINTPPLTMEIVRFDSKSDVPHNALADACGIRAEWLRQTRTKQRASDTASKTNS